MFACENGTVYFQQEENFFLALGECRSYSCTLDSKTGKSPEPAMKLSLATELHKTTGCYLYMVSCFLMFIPCIYNKLVKDANFVI